MDSDIRLVAFDVDGTLVEHDRGLVIWQLLNDRFGGGSAVNSRRYEAYLRGEISYPEWVRLDVEGWRAGGATRHLIEVEIREALRLVPFAESVVRELARRGYILAVVSGTLDIVLDVLFPNHPFHHVFTNRIAFDDTGAICSWQPTPFDMDGKADALRMLSRDLGLATQHFAYVGDHLNDCSAMTVAAFPIAYDPKDEKVRDLARHVLPKGRLDLLLDVLPDRNAISFADRTVRKR